MHTLPPCAGAGLPQVRRCVFTAKPQLWEQADQLDQAVHPPCTVQLMTATAIPAQGKPPFWGGGLLHCLDLQRHWSSPGPDSGSVWCEQGNQLDQLLYPPSTATFTTANNFHFKSEWFCFQLLFCTLLTVQLSQSLSTSGTGPNLMHPQSCFLCTHSLTHLGLSVQDTVWHFVSSSRTEGRGSVLGCTALSVHSIHSRDPWRCGTPLGCATCHSAVLVHASRCPPCQYTPSPENVVTVCAQLTITGSLTAFGELPACRALPNAASPLNVRHHNNLGSQARVPSSLTVSLT
jgi:hypothetical protein